MKKWKPTCGRYQGTCPFECESWRFWARCKCGSSRICRIKTKVHCVDCGKIVVDMRKKTRG